MNDEKLKPYLTPKAKMAVEALESLGLDSQIAILLVEQLGEEDEVWTLLGEEEEEQDG